MSKVVYRDRRNTDCLKWDGCEERFGRKGLLPLWVADMDFEAPACVKEALQEYVDFGVFGYYKPPKAYQDAFIRWEEKYHKYQVQREWLRFAPGVVPGFNWLVQILTEERDGVIIMPPVYYPFREAVTDNNRKLVASPLVRSEHSYEMDYEDFENKIQEQDVKLFIFCSPHNPAGRIWRPEEIRRIMDICKRHQVYVLSDEIHQDIVMPGCQQTVAATVGDYDEILVTLTAGTKTFNLAGCQNSILVIPDEDLRARYDGYTKKLRMKAGNAFGYIAVQSAYERGREWLEEVLEIVWSNYQMMKEILEKELPDVWIAELQGTYLMWIDLGSYVKTGTLEKLIRDKCHLAVDYGSWFGGSEYESFIRVNLATSKENIVQAAEAIVRAVKGKEEL